MTTALVSGAGGFVGHHLTRYLVCRGYHVIGVDLHYPEFDVSDAHQFAISDLRSFDNCLKACRGVDEVYHLAADMGGIGYITAHHADIARNNILIDTNMLEAARRQEVKRFLFSSSACVYPLGKQDAPLITPLREQDAWPADPEEGYGLEKLFTESLCRYYRRDYGLETRIARFHNVTGTHTAFEGGREKAPAAICRKVVLASNPGVIDVWGDGEQTRSFIYVDDCVEAVHRLMRSDYTEPVNIGTDRLVTVNELVDMVAAIAGKKIEKRHDLTKPQGVRGRNADLTLARQVLDWEPQVPLEDALARVYAWVSQVLSGRTVAQI